MSDDALPANSEPPSTSLRLNSWRVHRHLPILARPIRRRPLLLMGLPGLLFLTAVAASEGLPPLSSLIVPSLVIMLLVLLNGFFVAAEFAIIGVRPRQLEEMAVSGNRLAPRVLAILESPRAQDRYIATAQLGITLASVGLGMYAEPQIAHFIEPYLERIHGEGVSPVVVHTVALVIGLSLLTYLHIVLGEMVPKSLALASADKMVLALARPMALMQKLLIWPVRFLNGIGILLLRLFKIPPAVGHARLHSMEELELLVVESAEGGQLSEEEEELIRNIFDFGDRTVGQVMTPRPKVQAIPYNLPHDELLALVTQSRHSRFPVYEGDLDHVIGILHLKDLVRQHLRSKGKFDLRLIIRPAPSVPEKKPVEQLLTSFKMQRLHMAIVRDEFMGVAGIVTLEDLIEEVVGEVRDEFDLEKEPFVKLGPGLLEMEGAYLLDNLVDHVNLGSKEDLPEVETVGGLIITGLGRPPRVGDQLVYHNGVTFTVLDVDGLAVARVKVEFAVADDSELEDSNGR
jgi:CBS domain containing-hemolysin-like protein